MNQESQTDQDLIKQQQQEIQSVYKNEPLISQLKNLSELQQEYQNNQNFQTHLQQVSQSFPLLRKVRRDGNCFYRGFIFAMFENMIKDKNIHEKIFQKVKNAKEYMIKAGYEEIVIEDFLDHFLSKIEALKSVQIDQLQEIQQRQQFISEQQDSDYLVMFIRFLIGSEIKNNIFLYEQFLFDYESVQDFISKEVDVVDVQADFIQIMALVNYFEIRVGLAEITQTMYRQLTLPEESNDFLIANFLFMPGHYDLLYNQ